MKFSVTTMWERTETSSIHKDPNLWEEAHDRPSSHILGCMNSIVLFVSLDQWVGTSFSKSGLNEQYAIIARSSGMTTLRVIDLDLNPRLSPDIYDALIISGTAATAGCAHLTMKKRVCCNATTLHQLP